MKIAIYSGSFNPVHNGHVQLSKYLVDNNLVDEVWFIVSPCNPLKHQKDLIDERLRLEMLKLAIKSFPSFKASDIEFSMPIPSYSIDTLHKLSKLYPGHEFSLIIGSDNALVFDKWKNFKQLLSEYKVLVYPRKDFDFSEVREKYPQMKLLDTPYYDISSTQIRMDISRQKEVLNWIHPDVNRFINEHNLYR